ncbi:MAG: RimK family protein [Gammaproteobacteria bacterium]|nr:RimK family protein [Gammaproteobacteria bacterium]
MSAFYVVVENLNDWQPYYPSQDVITFDDYLEKINEPGSKRVRVINLCRSYRYLTAGYYCSLLAEARGHHVTPSLATINDLGRKSLASLQLETTRKILQKLEPPADSKTLNFHLWFGQAIDPAWSKLGQSIFESLPCPLLEVSLAYKNEWQIKQVKAISLKSLTDPHEQEVFASTFEKFSNKMWRKPKARKACRYDLAILINADEEMPPSDNKALKLFEKSARQLGIATDFITKKDYIRLPEYDGLFIRETTAVDHHTYRFAKKAEAEDLVVIDDPTSILRCTNKIYLADLLTTHKIPTPKTAFLTRISTTSLQKLINDIGLPMVLKIPDGSFSRGIIKVETQQQLEAGAKELMRNSALLLAQEFLYTEYDWRIGVLNNKPLYACRYYMVNDHWQIYQHGEHASKSGDFETLPILETPKQVLDIATKATRLIGNGLYGVDIKQSADRVVVIEVNDNPSIEAGVEDKYLGDQLYLEIMGEFLRRMETRGR